MVGSFSNYNPRHPVAPILESPGEAPLLHRPDVPLPIGNDLVPYGTPLHVVEVVLLLLKITFDELPEGHPYKFSDDYEKTGILFDVNLNRGGEVWGKKPLVIISRGNQNAGIAMLGDMATQNLPLNARHGSNLVDTNIDIKVVSKSKAECEIICQIIFSALMVIRTLLPKLCGIHMASGVSLSSVSKFDMDDEMFLGQIMMQFSMQYTWEITTPIHLIKSIETHIKTPGWHAPRHKKQEQHGAASD